MGWHTLDPPVSGQGLVTGYMADFLIRKETTSLSRQNLHHTVSYSIQPGQIHTCAVFSKTSNKRAAYVQHYWWIGQEKCQCCAYSEYRKKWSAYLKNGTILQASFSAERKPCENSITSAMSWRSGFVIAKDRNNFFKLSGRFDRPA